MMKRFFETKYGSLVFSLFSGLAYFGLILCFILDNTGAKGVLLGVFFFPAIVCGMALVLYKGIAQWKEQEKYRTITAVAVGHILLMLLSVMYVVVRVIY